MASIVLTAVGTALGGPVGAAVGFLAGEQLSASTILGGGSREGPRVKDLSVTTSSYGQPIARHFGAMRVPGTIIWSTDLVESRDTNGGSKGKPKTTTYSYSASLAVALGSRPIHSVGRIWADGNLLRGAAGDLKVPGVMRIYEGHADQPIDPIIASKEGSDCPAFRGCAYIVFEDLALGDFGNRIPSLTFEVFADPVSSFSLAQIIGPKVGNATSIAIPSLHGFSDEGGSLRSNLGALATAFDLQCIDGADSFELAIAEGRPTGEQAQFSALLAKSPDDGPASADFDRQRNESVYDRPSALRYYDQDRDYQPGVQRAATRKEEGREHVLELPAAMTANGAKQVINGRAQRAQWIEETIIWRVAELDPQLGPGSALRIPEVPGIWRITDWEWSNEGVALQLERIPPALVDGASGETGVRLPPLDTLPWPTQLAAFELPWDGMSNPSSPAIFAAATAGGANWRGATLFAEQSGTLQQLADPVTRRNTMGELLFELAPSPSLILEASAAIHVAVAAPDLSFDSVSIEALAAGRNRLLVGDEILQFSHAEQIGDMEWRLSGLLRGRAGTEEFAMQPHPVGTRCIALDDTLVAIDPLSISTLDPTIAAIGFGDEDPVYAAVNNAGTSRSPLAPVHTKATVDASGDLSLTWTRRARGQWLWSDHVDTPLVEENESYAVGFGDPASPLRSWFSPVPQLKLGADEVADIVETYGSGPLWVRQLGTYGQSASTLLAHLPI